MYTVDAIACRDVRFKEPNYAVEHLPVEAHKTYLDTTGRTVLVFRKTNLVEQHIQEFEVASSSDSLRMRMRAMTNDYEYECECKCS